MGSSESKMVVTSLSRSQESNEKHIMSEENALFTNPSEEIRPDSGEADQGNTYPMDLMHSNMFDPPNDYYFDEEDEREAFRTHPKNDTPSLSNLVTWTPVQTHRDRAQNNGRGVRKRLFHSPIEANALIHRRSFHGMG